jgi:hypothetical protein|eukprot:COSAG02_NODE_5841_length_3995_cov_2.348819_2_plen_75_part_00
MNLCIWAPFAFEITVSWSDGTISKDGALILACRWRVAKELDLIDQGTVDIQRRNINSDDHKKKRFDLDFYISLW